MKNKEEDKKNSSSEPRLTKLVVFIAPIAKSRLKEEAKKESITVSEKLRRIVHKYTGIAK